MRAGGVKTDIQTERRKTWENATIVGCHNLFRRGNENLRVRAAKKPPTLRLFLAFPGLMCEARKQDAATDMKKHERHEREGRDAWS